MIGDKIKIKPHHTNAAEIIFKVLQPKIKRKYVVTIAGESGSGKSEIAIEIRRFIEDKINLSTFILQQDDYFVLPPKTNAEKRREMITWVGTREVQLSLMDDHLRKFREGAAAITKPLVVFEEDRIDEEDVDFTKYKVLIAEGTYTTLLRHADARVFILRDYRDTQADRTERAREHQDEFLAEVLAIEHRIISAHKEKADIWVHSDFTVTIRGQPVNV